MSDIHTILSKHFTGETTSDEELLVQQFKLENPEEYLALQSFWAKKNIQVEKFDSEKAWQNVVRKADKTRPRGIYRQLKIAAAVAAVLLLGSVIGFKLLSPSNVDQVIANGSQETIKKILLEDGSIVYLNEDATLHYPEKFSTNQRQVTLQGEAFFEIAKDSNRPFRIHTNHSVIKVLGTSFNIDTKTNKTEVSVATGKVEVRSLTNDVSAILTPNQSAVADENTIDVFSTEDKNYMSWKTGIFHFDETPIAQVVEELNIYYDNQILLSNPNADCLFTTSIDQLALKDVVEIIQLTCNLKLNKKNNIYELY